MTLLSRHGLGRISRPSRSDTEAFIAPKASIEVRNLEFTGCLTPNSYLGLPAVHVPARSTDFPTSPGPEPLDSLQESMETTWKMARGTRPKCSRRRPATHEPPLPPSTPEPNRARSTHRPASSVAVGPETLQKANLSGHLHDFKWIL